MAVETHTLDSYYQERQDPVGAQMGIHPFTNEVTVDQLDGDATSVLKILRISKGRIPVGFNFFCDDLEGASPAGVIDLIISDNTTTKVLINNSTICQSGGIINEQDSALAELATWYGVDFITSSDFFLAVRISTAFGANEQAGTITGYLKTLGRGAVNATSA